MPGDLISCSVVMNESKIDDTTWLANSIVKCNSWCKAYDVRLITSEAYKAELVGSLTYSIGSVSAASYGFSQTSDGYYTSQNAGVANSAALCRITFVNTTGSAKTVTLNCILIRHYVLHIWLIRHTLNLSKVVLHQAYKLSP